MKARPYADLTGKTFGRLTVLRRSARQHLNITWECRCSCGGTSLATTSNLKAGTSKSCGCLRRELPKLTKTRHGHKPESGASTEYQVWVSMKKRCENPRCARYKDYGGRGIKVCDRWQKFENFLADMGHRPTGLTLERLDNNGDYEKDNCAWRTPAAQSRNMRKNRRVAMPDGSTMIFTDAAAHLGVTHKTLTYWLNKCAGDMSAAIECMRNRANNPKARRRVTGRENYFAR